VSIPIPPIPSKIPLPNRPPAKLPKIPSANPAGTVPLPKTSMARPNLPVKLPGASSTAPVSTPGTVVGRAKQMGTHAANQVGQDAGLTGAQKAKSAAKDVAKEAAAGAVKGLAGGGAGALAGAGKGAAKALLKNKHSRNVLIGLLAIQVIMVPAIIIGLVTAMTSSASSSVDDTDKRTSAKAVTDSGKTETYIVGAQDTVTGTGIPWEIAAAALSQREDPIDTKKLQKNLDVQDPTAAYRDMNAGRTYSSSTGARTIGTGNLADDAAKVKSVWVPALAATLDIDDASAGSVYDQALSWHLGQSLGSCGVDLSIGTDTGDGTTVQLNASQLAIAKTIIGVAKSGFTTEADQRQASIIGIATGMQESTLANLDHGDLDSLGVFQQRASWGTTAQRQDPAYAAGKFFKKLITVSGWQNLAITVAAQKVQVSGFPDAYAKWESLARATVAAQFTETIAVTIPDAVGYPGAMPGATAPTGDGSSSCVTGIGQAVLPVTNYIVASNFGPRAAPCAGCSSFHLGLDLSMGSCSPGTKPGQPVFAAMGGTVVYAKVLFGASGNTIELDHGNGIMTQYLHLYDDTMLVKTGDTVIAGQQIANMGSTGHSTGCHLHFSTLVNGKQTDPRLVMAPFGIIFKPLS
jgi:murein DD-endopeptidase MepM/ murein hydrolase activator NlpD